MFQKTQTPALDLSTDPRYQWATLLQTAIDVPGTLSTAFQVFHRYSLGNQLLALAQCVERKITPGPLATYAKWQSLSRQVRKGEKALVLCQPVTIKAKGKATEAVPEGEDRTFTRFTYKPRWFVLAQTDGDVMPPIETPTWDAARALPVLDITRIPYDLTDGNCQGYATGRTVAISPLATDPEKTLFHELAHILLGHTAEGTMADDARTPRTLREVEAESVALLCGEALGLPGAAESRGYIQHWNKTGEAIPEASARRIFKAADQILKAGAPAVETETEQ